MNLNPSSPAFYVMVNGGQKGPFSLSQMQAMWRANIITNKSQYWKEGMPAWSPCSTIAPLLSPPKSTDEQAKQTPPPLPNTSSTPAASFWTLSPGGIVVAVICGFLLIVFILAGMSPHEMSLPSQSSRATGTDSSNFERWAHESTAVTDISIRGGSLFVTLTADKYTNRDNVRVIAEQLARAFCLQTGQSSAACHVYLGKEEYAVGRYP